MSKYFPDCRETCEVLKEETDSSEKTNEKYIPTTEEIQTHLKKFTESEETDYVLTRANISKFPVLKVHNEDGSIKEFIDIPSMLLEELNFGKRKHSN